MDTQIKIISTCDLNVKSDFLSLINLILKTPHSLPWHGAISQLDSDSFLEKYSAAENSEIYFIYLNSSLISAGIISANDSSAKIELLCIHPDYHGQGLGPKMLQLFEAFAKAKNAKQMIANLSSLERIDQFYLRNCFTREQNYYVKPVLTGIASL